MFDFCNNIDCTKTKRLTKTGLKSKEYAMLHLFYAGDLQNVRGLLLALGIWLRFYDKKLQLELLLNSFLQTLKNEIYLEINTK